MTPWEIKAKEFANCNCAYGCPCQFNALPTHGNCEAAVAMEIEKGHYGAGFGIPVTLHWEFYFNDTWSAFAEIGFQVFFHPRFFENGDFYADAGAWVIAMVGGSLHFSEAIALTLRFGNPYVAIGLTFQF
jgi:hypothetical protein